MPTLSAEQAVRDRIISDSAITAEIGSRVWPDVSSQEPTLPFVILERISSNITGNLAGTGTLREVVMTLDIFGQSALSQQTIAELITSRLNNWQDLTIGVHACFVTPGDSQETDFGRTFTLNVSCWFDAV